MSIDHITSVLSKASFIIALFIIWDFYVGEEILKLIYLGQYFMVSFYSFLPKEASEFILDVVYVLISLKILLWVFSNKSASINSQ